PPLSLHYSSVLSLPFSSFFFCHPPPPTAIYTLSLHDALPICTATSGRPYPTTPSSPTASAPNGKPSSSTWCRAHPFLTTCSRGPEGCTWPRPDSTRHAPDTPWNWTRSPSHAHTAPSHL